MTGSFLSIDIGIGNWLTCHYFNHASVHVSLTSEALFLLVVLYSQQAAHAALTMNNQNFDNALTMLLSQASHEQASSEQTYSYYTDSFCLKKTMLKAQPRSRI
jgi:hypothetical protein